MPETGWPSGKMGARWHAMEGPTPRGEESERQGVNRGGGEMFIIVYHKQTVGW